MENFLWVIEYKSDRTNWHPLVHVYNISCIHYTRAKARQALQDVKAAKHLYGRNYYRVKKYTSA